MEEAKQEMRDAGFKSTPWDNPGGQQSFNNSNVAGNSAGSAGT